MTQSTIRGIQNGAHLYFIGIGGISMSGLAEIAFHNGFRVSGSDNHSDSHLERLQKLGVTLFTEQVSSNIDQMKPDYIVYTAAIPAHNEELTRARELGIPCLDRAVFLGGLTESFEKVLNISGTHGKTTCTAMVSSLLIESGLNPTVHLGAFLERFNHSTIRLGEPAKLLISEACEFNNSFWNFRSTSALITNIDLDHLDFFHHLDNILDSFVGFALKFEDEARLVLPCKDPYIDDFLLRLSTRFEKEALPLPRFAFFGLAEDFETRIQVLPPHEAYKIHNLIYVEGYPQFTLEFPNGHHEEVQLNIPGFHNVLNATASIALADPEGLKMEAIQSVFQQFRGAEGRFTINGKFKGATIVSDYAHHPSAVRATIQAASQLPHNKLIVVLQPLTFSRVKLLFEDYLNSLYPFDLNEVIFYEVFSDREQNTLGMTSRLLHDAYQDTGRKSRYAYRYEQLYEDLDKTVGEGDLVLFLGPEEIRRHGKRLASE